MCGIAGALNFQKKQDFSIQALLNIMKHRGPDESSSVQQDTWSIGANRLAITSPKEKNTQPLWSPDKRFCFVFNGEIYNYKKIKTELLAKNCIFKTSCDSEALFYAFLEYQDKAFLKCQGMFACAIFDTFKQLYYLIRDPFGIKPLYFQIDSQRLAFASEIKALLSLKKSSINKKALPEYLQRRFVLGKKTLFSNIYRVLPGEIITISINGEIKSKQYWSPKIKSQSDKNKPERLEEFSSLLKESVHMSANSDVGAGILLSGGLDSSVIDALTCSFAKNPSLIYPSSSCSKIPSAYFFDNGYDLEERISTERLTQKWNQKLHIVCPEEQDFLLLPKIIQALEEPLGDSIILPTYKLMEKASQKERVVLSGEGADELLGGYSHHHIFYVFQKLPFINFAAGLMVKIFPESFLNVLFPYPGKIEKQALQKALLILNNSGLKRFIETSHLFSTENIDSLIPGLLPELKEEESPYPDLLSLKDLICFDIQNWLAHYNLLRVDKLSMIHSLEVRIPYLNLDFASFCLSLPTEDILSLFCRKKILRKLALKKSVLNFKSAYRRKHPFTFKEQKIYGKKYTEFITDHLDESFQKTYGMDPKFLDIFKKSLYSDKSSDKLAGPALLSKKSEGEKHNKNLIFQKQISSLFHLAVWTKEFF